MKSLLLLLSLLAVTFDIQAQNLQLNLIMNPRPSPFLSDWAERSETAILNIQNPSTSIVPVKLDVRILRDGQIRAASDFGKMPVLQVMLGGMTINAQQIVPLEGMSFFGSDKNISIQTGKLPSSNYQICLTLLHAETGLPLSQQVCKNFEIVSYQLPYLLQPQNAATLSCQQVPTIVFRWSPVSPVVQGGVVYHVALFEVLAGQTAANAFRSNQPIMQRDVFNATQLIFPSDIDITLFQPQPNLGTATQVRNYVWSVRTTDQAGRILTDNDGWSEPYTFSVSCASTGTGSGDGSKCACEGKLLGIGYSADKDESAEYVGGPYFLIEGNPSSSCSFSSSLSFWPIFRLNCVMPCMPKLSGSMSFVFTDSKGVVSTLTASGSGLGSSISPPSSGTITATFTGEMFCGSASCGPVTATRTITVTKVAAGGSTDVSTKDERKTTPGGSDAKTPGTGTRDNPGGGTTETPPGTTTRKKCGCECTVKSTFEVNSDATGTTFSAVVTGGCKLQPCPDNTTVVACTHKITYDWTVGGLDIVEVIGGLTSASVKVRCKKPGWYSVSLAGMLICSDGTKCPFNAGFEEYCPPPDTTVGMACKPPIQTSEPGPPISLGSKVDSPSEFPYPRAVPIRATAVDVDLGVIQCKPCQSGATGEEKIPLEDGVSYTWTLDGKGTLNTLPSIVKANAIAKDIDDLILKMAQLKSRIDSLETEKKEIPKNIESQKDAAKKDKDVIEKEIDSLATRISSMNDKIAVYTKQIAAAEKSISDAMKTMGEQRDESASLKRQMDSLDLVLQAKPSTEELAKLKDVDAQQKATATAEKTRTADAKKLADRTSELAKTLSDLLKEYKTAQTAYESVRTSSSADAKSVGSFQTLMYPLGAPRDFFKAQRDFNDKASTWITMFASSDATLKADLKTAHELADSALSTSMLPPRTTLGAMFGAKLSSLYSAMSSVCGSIADKPSRDACSASLTVVSSSLSLYATTHSTVLASVFVLDLSIKSKITAARTKITSRESLLKAAETTLRTKAEAYAAAIESNKTELSKFADKLAVSTKKYEEESDKLSALQAELKVMELKRQETLDRNRASILSQRGILAAKKRASDSTSRALMSLQVTLSDSILTLKGLSVVAKKEIEALEKQKNILETQKTALDEIIAIDVNKIVKAIDDQIALAKKEIEELKKAVEDKKKEKDAAMTGEKTAVGELVYYVPPPLEVLMNEAQKKRFEELKDSVRIAEEGLSAALAQKQASQKQLASLLERVARETLRYRDANDAAATASDDIDSLKRELSHVKNDSKKQQAADQLKAQSDIKDAEAEVKKREDKVKDYESKIDKLARDIASQEAKVVTAKEEAATAGKKVLELKAGLDKEKDLESKATQTLNERTADLDKAKEVYKEKHGITGQARSELNHAIAANNQAAAVSARASVQKADAEEKLAKTKISSAETDIKSANASLKSATLRVAAATKSYDDARKEFVAKSQARIAAIDMLNELNKRLEKDLNPRLEAAKNAVTEAKENLDDKKEARTALNEKINEGLDSLESVKHMEKEIADAQATKKNGETIAKESASSVQSALTDKDSVISSANDSLKAARERLVAANKSLHDFLLAIFEKPELKDKITITADDTVLDSWRAGDAVVEEIKQISYSGRIPVFANTEPKSSGARSKTDGECPLVKSFLTGSPIVASDPSLLRKEPRTIALIYKDGEPLWKEWAVIPEAEPILARDYTMLVASASDADISHRTCGPAPRCAGMSNGGGIIEPVKYSWALEGGSVLGKDQASVVWKASEIPKPRCKKSAEHSVLHSASAIGPDATVTTKMKPEVKAGVLLEVTQDLKGAPKTIDTVVARIACGDHKGLSGEDIEIIVKVKPDYAKLAKGFGLEKADQTTITKATDADGYVRIPFLYGSGFAEYDISVEWKRSGCEKKTLLAITPLNLQFIRLAESTPDVAYQVAKKMWDGKLSLDAAAKMLPARDDDADRDPNYKKTTTGIVGLTDNNRESVNDVVIEFIKNSKNSRSIVYTPSKAPTELFGIARTILSNLPKNEKTEVWLKARCEELALRKLCTPEDVEGKKAGKVNRFKIGNAALPFIVELDQDASLGEAISGTAKLIIESRNAFLQSLINVPLNVNGVFLAEAGAGLPIAKNGFVSWQPSQGKEVSYKGFSFRTDSLSITAAGGAMIGGRIAHETYLPDGAGFSAELETSGNFFGTVSDLPELHFAKCTLKKGSSFTLDMHDKRDEADLFDELKPFAGIVINKAELVLPKTFATQNGKDTVESELSVESFAIGRKYDGGSVAIGGRVKISGKFFAMGFGGWKCDFSSLELAFANSELKEGKLSGALHMPMPFEGDLDVEISGSKEEWSGTFTTLHPISVPKIKTVFSLLDGTSINYKTATALATLKINATATCEYFKRLDIKNLTLDNTGKIVGEVSITEPNIKFSRGFDLAISKLTIKKEDGEDLSITIKGTFSIPKIIALKGGVELTTGPSVKVSLDEAKLKFDYGPCSFSGGFTFSETEFRGDFDIGLKNLCNGGISGLIIAGIQKVDEERSYTYWYGELSMKVAIPLGQTGLFLTELGGGVGYNYEPPMGTQSGNPKELPNSLSFKAIVGIGTPATGAVVNSRVEFVLIPWTDFRIYGKIWLLNKKDALFGEGQLNLSTEPAKLDGYVRLFIGLPDAEGKVLSFDGKVAFLYSAASKYIKSEKLSGSALQVIKAEGTIDITEDYVKLDGSLRYDFDKKLPLGVVDFYVSLHAYAGGKFSYINATSSLSADAEFKGSIDVKGDFAFYGMTTLVTGSATVKAKLAASPTSVKIAAEVHVSYSVFGFSDSLDLDVGYSS